MVGCYLFIRGERLGGVIMIRILHKLGLVHGVFLEDFEGEIYKTWMIQSPFGHKYAYVYPFVKIGYVQLWGDGTCSSTCYIERWRSM